MLSLRLVRRFSVGNPVASSSIASSDIAFSCDALDTNSNVKLTRFDEPALFKLKAERDPEKLFLLFKENAHNKLLIENRFAFEDTVSRLAGARKFDYIEHLLEQQKALPQGRREGFVIRIITLYEMAGMIDHAVKTFNDMHLYGCRRTVKSFNAALKALAQTRDLEAIESFLRDVPVKYDVKLDICSVNIVIKALCEMGIPDKAYLIMLQSEKFGIQADVVSYTTLISSFYKINRCEIGNGLWNLMVCKGCLPNLATFNARIQYLVSRGRAWDANQLLCLMRYVRICPDEVTYNLVIKGFFRAGYLEMAKKIYNSLHLEGFRPNVKIYQTMIHYLCRGGEFKLAYTLCKDSMKNNWFPNIDTVFRLLEGLHKQGEKEKANYIIKLSQNRVPPFPAKQLDDMKSVLYQS